LTASPTATVTETSSATPTETATLTVTPTGTACVPTNVVTVIDGITITVTAPCNPDTTTGGGVHYVVAVAPTPPPVTPSVPNPNPVFSFTVDGFDDNGNAVTTLPGPVTLTVKFTPAVGTDPTTSVIYTIDHNGQTEALATTLTDNGDGTFTAMATITHLSPFSVIDSLVVSPSSTATSTAMATATSTATATATSMATSTATAGPPAYRILMPLVANGPVHSTIWLPVVFDTTGTIAGW
jgi:hypothetical protein